MRLPPKYHPGSQSLPDQATLIRLIMISGIALLGLLFLTRLYESTTYSFFAFANAARHSSSTTGGKVQDRTLPTFVTIPSLQIGLPIEEVANNSLFWKTSTGTVSHISQSAVPGEASNVVLYGQNTTDVFGRLTSLRKGNKILVITQDGETHSYSVSDLLIASPTEAGVIGATEEETLTLYTSFGIANMQRFVVKAHPTN